MERIILKNEFLRFAIPIVLFFAASLMFFDYVVDDAYIHMTFVRNLAVLGEFSFNPGTPVYGSTSPIWIIINALFAFILPFFSVFVIVKTFSYFLSLLSLILFMVYCRIHFNPSMAFLLSLLFSCNPWFLRWSFSGMEVGLVLSLVLGILLTISLFKGLKLGLTCGLLAGMLLLTRPEFILFAGILLIHLALLREQTLKQKLIIIGSFCGTFLIVVLPWFIYAELVFGTIKPNTVVAKSVGYYLIPRLLWVKRLALILLSGHPVELLLLGYFMISAYKVRKSKQQWLEFFLSTWLLWAWPCGLFAGYLFTHSPISSRYTLMATPFAALFVGHLIAFINPTFLQNEKPYSTILLSLGLVGITSSTILLGFVIYPQIIHYNSAMKTYSEFILRFQQMAKPGDQIAAGDVGILGYLNKGDYVVVDLHALVTTSAIPMRRFQYDVNYYLRDTRVDWLLENAPSPNHLSKTDKLTMIQQDLWLLKPYIEFVDSAFLGPYGVAESQDQYYSLYRINWEKYDSDQISQLKP